MARKEYAHYPKTKRKVAVRLAVIVSVSLFIAVFNYDLSFGFRCGGKIISIGDTKFDVITLCGEPSFKDSWIENRIQRDFYRELFPKGEKGSERKLERENYREPLFVEEYVVIEEWTYNLGSNRFIRYLRFENGRLVRIRTGKYGY